jgi:hypothetical protein
VQLADANMNEGWNYATQIKVMDQPVDVRLNECDSDKRTLYRTMAFASVDSI